MKSIPIKDLVPNTYFTDSIFLDEKYILTSPDVPVSESLIKKLDEWRFFTVYSDGVTVKTKPAQDTVETVSETETVSLIIESDPHEREKLDAARAVFDRLLEFTEKTFTDYVQKGELQVELIGEMVKDILHCIKDERNAILRIVAMDVQDKNYLVIHSAKTTILTLVSGHFLKFPPHKLIELGIASIIHEIGMVRLPPHLYMAPRGLTPQEKRAVMTHPLLGFNILKGLSFPMTICSTVLEHHERMDGSGYPRAVSGEKISQHARVLAVCCSYDALVSKRPYRDARDGHEGILNLLRDRGVQYDEQALRALVYSLSIFPLGSYILLSTGAKAVVVEASPQSPRYPLVKIIADEEGYLYKEPQLIQTNESEHSIIRMLTLDEIKALQD